MSDTENEPKRKLEYFTRLMETTRTGNSDIELAYEYPDGWSSWKQLGYMKELLLSNTHRSLLPTEFVFDIDAVDYGSAKDYLLSLTARFKAYEIPYYIWSSGRYFHVHVFYDFQSTELSDKQRKKFTSFIYSYSVKLGRILTAEETFMLGFRIQKAFPLWLTDGLDNEEKAWVDTDKFKKQIRRSRVLIRAEGSKNEKTGFYKTLVSEGNLDYRATHTDGIIYPSEIRIWKPSGDVFSALFFATYKEYFKPRGASSESKAFRKRFTTPVSNGYAYSKR